MNSTMKPRNRSEDARRDMIAGGIVVAAIVMFVGTGGNVMQAVVQTLIGIGGGPARVQRQRDDATGCLAENDGHENQR